jgi:NAD+ synthase
MKSPEKVKNHVIDWLKKYLLESKQEGFIVGVSGGIDSAVTSTLCANTGLPVYVIEMPIHQNSNEILRAKDHMEWLSSNFKNVITFSHSLTKVFDTFKGEIEKNKKAEPNLLSLANSRARLRMTTLYYFAGSLKCLVTGTGNKVEDFGVGFYTKYGDGGVDISPIADLKKSEIFHLANHLNIIKSILAAKPTDGLWDDGRTDEDQMGANYKDLENAMDLIERKVPNSDLSENEIKTRDIYKKLHFQNKHKMLPIPVCKIPNKYL